jgi:recombination protein RecT
MTTKAEQLKNQLAQTAQQTGAPAQQKPLTPSQQVGHYLKEMMPTLQSILPKHVTAERMSRIALNVIRTNPKLLQCNVNSLMGGVMEAAKLGLEPGLMGQCYLIPFEKKAKQGNQWVTVDIEAQFIIGYKGLIDLVRRSGQVSTIEARTVYENDEFDFGYGLDNYLKHKPTLVNRGAAIAYYAVCKLKDGGSSFLVMSHQEMEQYRDKYAKAKGRGGVVVGPWADEFDAMARKTVLRQLIKYLPISVEHLSAFDEQSGAAVHDEMEKARLIDLGEYVPTVEDEQHEEEQVNE